MDSDAAALLTVIEAQVKLGDKLLPNVRIDTRKSLEQTCTHTNYDQMRVLLFCVQ
jgi:hypothetical protein